MTELIEDPDLMAAKKRRGPQRPAKGFRPGKEPAHLKRQRAKAQLGKDASWAQRQTLDAVAGRTSDEVRKMVRKWSVGALAGALLLGVAGVFLYAWAVPAGVVVHVVSVALFFLAYRIRKQGPGLAEMADSL
jgi:hypothetical protein